VEDADQHTRVPARTRRLGCPNRSSATSSHSNQCNLHLWLGHTSSLALEGTSPNIHHGLLANLLCYRFRALSVQYGGNLFLVSALLNDPHSGVEWYLEPHLNAIVHIRGKIEHVRRAFHPY